MAKFRLSKWYLDCVTDEGDASICYAGEAKWAFLRIHYSSLLKTTGNHVGISQTLRRQTPPEVLQGSIRWESKALRIFGEWRPSLADDQTLRELRNTIFASEEGSIDWRCLVPCGPACIGTRSGLGYVEHLTMTVPPWQFPTCTLRWGRFTSHSHSLIWIDCLGEFSRRLVYLNGFEATAAAIHDDLLELTNGMRVTMDRSLTIRQGHLGTTVLSAIPGKALPARILRVNEHKWRSRARLEHATGPPVEGWAIHERVDWPP